MKVEYTTEINCPPAKLWPWLEEPEKQKQWMKGLLENVPTSEGPTRVGSTFKMKIKEGGRVSEYDGEITGYEKNRHLAVKMWGPAMKGMVVFVDYKLHDVSGRTRLDYVSTVDTSKASPFLKFLMPLFKLFGKMQLKGFMKTLKKLAESDAK